MNVCYTTIRKRENLKMKGEQKMYRVARFDFINGWRYFNVFATWTEAVEACRRYERIYGGRFEIFSD